MKTSMKNSFVTLMVLVSLIATAQDKNALPLPDSSNVTLTLDEYNKLMELASRPAKKIDNPPLPYAVKHAELKLHVENDCVAGTAQFEGEVFRKGINKVPLTTGVTVFDAH